MTTRIDIAQFKGHWALVTGASAGLGREFAEQLAAAGMHVALVARREQRLTELATQLATRHGVSTLVIPVDLSLSSAVDDIVTAVKAGDVRIRVLCNNAAFGHWGHFEDAPEETYQRMVQVNATTMAGLCRRLLPDLRSFPRSAIINVASGASFQPVPYMAVYAGTKAFVMSFSLALHGELSASGVHVQTLVPGPTATEFDALAGAPAALVGRGSARDVVADSLRQLSDERPLAANAKGIFKQRAFNGLAPIAVVIKTVARMFRPPHAALTQVERPVQALGPLPVEAASLTRTDI